MSEEEKMIIKAISVMEEQLVDHINTLDVEIKFLESVLKILKKTKVRRSDQEFINEMICNMSGFIMASKAKKDRLNELLKKTQANNGKLEIGE